MKLSKDRTQIVYNHFLTLSGIPPEAFEYKLGNKSALHWIIDHMSGGFVRAERHRLWRGAERCLRCPGHLQR